MGVSKSTYYQYLIFNRRTLNNQNNRKIVFNLFSPIYHHIYYTKNKQAKYVYNNNKW